jgi:peptidoglycan hydrolase CwlO-like protein
MPTGLESILSVLPGATGYTLLAAVSIFVLRYAYSQDKRLRAEVIAHQDTQSRYDEEREARRAAEDKVARLTRKVDDLSTKVEDLSAEVARLRGAVVDGR